MLITVVTPTRNAMEYLDECIQSVKENVSDKITIDHVIVDAGSTDGTPDFARKKGVRVIEGEDEGIFDAINIGSLSSAGELLGFLGADDIMLSGALDSVADAYEKSGRRWVVGGIRWINEKGQSLGELAAPPSWLTTRAHVCLGWNPIMHMSTYVSRDLFDELSGFNIVYKHSGDYDFFTRALSKEPYARLPFPISCFRRTGLNNSVVHKTAAALENEKILNEFGPSSSIERQFWKLALKVFLNAANPHWMIFKFTQPIRIGLNLQEKRYF